MATDALPYFDREYEDPYIKEMVSFNVNTTAFDYILRRAVING